MDIEWTGHGMDSKWSGQDMEWTGHETDMEWKGHHQPAPYHQDIGDDTSAVIMELESNNNVTEEESIEPTGCKLCDREKY